jgi:hypothetical protein
MSLFQPVNLVCPNCSALITMDAVGSVNADRRPDLRVSILANDFQDASCHECEHSLRLQPNFNFLDVGRSQWIASMPASYIGRFGEIGGEVQTLFDQSYGKKAPAAAQSVGNGLSVRLTFGWPALREKLYVREVGLDDITLELCKLDLMRRLPEVLLGAGIELRLLTVAGDHLSFAWIDSATEEVKSQFNANRALYDAIADAPDAWANLAKQIGNSAFADIQKLYLTERQAA